MSEDFDADSLETIEPIEKMREQKQKRQLNDMLKEYYLDSTNEKLQHYFKEKNILIVPREGFDHSTNEQIEAWFTKFDQVFIDDSKMIKPKRQSIFSKDHYVGYDGIEHNDSKTSKKELAKKIGLDIYSSLNKKNLQKGIGMIQKSTDMISEFGNAFGNNASKTKLSFGNSKADTSFLTSKPKKYKRNSLKIWSDDIKPKKRKYRKKKAVQADKYSALTGGKKVSFSSNRKVKFF